MPHRSKPVGTVHSETLEALHRHTGHRFDDLARLDRALTHSSARQRTGKDYERLEFLGDRVLGLCIAELLFERFPQADEGEMSVRLNALVNAETLASVSDDMDLHLYIRAGSDIVDITSPRQKNIRADVVEALIASMYLEGGLEAARSFIQKHWTDRLNSSLSARRDAKTELQEWAHRVHHSTPVYSILSREGPDHEPVFTVTVTVEKLPATQATGHSKRMAEQAAAEAFLLREGVRQPDGSDGK